ncbi:MAG: NAD(P)/FAD-dependent oxidoreductase [Patescibacteria group bacterium]
MNDQSYFDVIIIGAGITGIAVARELARYDRTVAVLDKAVEAASGTTKANGGVVHSGYHARPGSLMAELNVRGNVLYRTLCRELEVELHETGSLMVALAGEDTGVLEHYREQGRQNGVPGMELVGRTRLLALEPNLSTAAAAGLYSPTTAMVSPYEFALALAENAAANGVRFFFEAEVLGFALQGGRIEGVRTTRGDFRCSFLVNAAGIRADELAAMAGDDSFRIHPRKGELLALDRKLGWLVRRVIYPMPTPASKGILIVPAVEGNTVLASTAEDIEDKTDLRTTAAGREELLVSGGRLVPAAMAPRQVIAQFAGLRAVAGGDDFIIRPSAVVEGLIHAAGIQSPGLASAPAVAEKVAGLLRQAGLELRARPDFNPARRAMTRIMHMNRDQFAAKIREDTRYGNVVCRCERVSEAEVIEAIRRPVGACTLDGIKRRTRAQTGRCQGSYCTCRLMEILARELDLPFEQVTKDGAGSEMVAGPTKAGYTSRVEACAKGSRSG